MVKRIMSQFKRFDRWSHTEVGRNKLGQLAVIALFITVLILGMTISAHAHDVHLSDVTLDTCPIEAVGWISGMGAIIHTYCNDADQDWWLLYKDGDFIHSNVHVKPILQGIEVLNESD